MSNRPRLSEKTIAFSQKTIFLPSFKQIKQLCIDAHKYSGIQPKIAVVLAPSHLGKSKALTHYYCACNDHANKLNSDWNFTPKPCLYIELYSSTNLNGFLAQLLIELGIKNAKSSERLPDLKQQVISKLKLYKTEIILVDEVQHIVPKSGVSKTQQVADLIKTISNETKVPFILCGLPTSKRLFDVEEDIPKSTHVDETEKMQLANRKLPVLEIKPIPYSLNPNSIWNNLLISYQQTLDDLEIPCVLLTSEELSTRLWLSCLGVIGRLKYVLQEAIEVFESNKNQHSKMDIYCLSAAYDKVAGWAPPEQVNPFNASKAQINRLLAKEVDDHG